MALGLMIFIFGSLIMFGGALCIYELIRGNRKNLWPGLVGVLFAAALLIGTFVGIWTEWGGCDSKSATSEGAVVCIGANNCPTGCLPDVWKVDCKKQSTCPAPEPPERGQCAVAAPAPPAGPQPALAPNSYCPKGQRAVYDYCERIEPNSAVKQKWATWSDLSFVAAGLWIFWLFRFFNRIGDHTRPGTWLVAVNADNPMVVVGPLSVIYGLIVIFMGPPSMWFHASMKEWAGWFDSMSVVAWLFFNAVYVWYTICGPMWGRGRGMARWLTVVCIWASGVVTFGIVGWIYPDARLIFYFISGGLWGFGEAIYLLIGGVAKGIEYKRNGWIFFVNLVNLGITMTIWVFWNPGITNCITRESFPGHAVFHILASLSCIITYFSFASEKPKYYNPTEI